MSIASDIAEPMVSNEIIQALLDGERVCSDCVAAGATPQTEACSHRQAQLEAVLAQHYVTIYVPWYVCHDGQAVEWPSVCGLCDAPINECPICGLGCDCPRYYDYAPFCWNCVIDDDGITIDGGVEIDDILMAALQNRVITIYRRAIPAHQMSLF
jgi:hypothetical protein